MRVTVDQSALVKALAGGASIVEARNTVPILSNALLRADGEALRISVTNLDMTHEVACKANVEMAGAVTVSARHLREIAGACAAGSQIRLQRADNGRVAVSSGRSKWALPCLPASDFPDAAAVLRKSPAISFSLDASTLTRLLKFSRTAHSTETVRYYLNGVCVFAGEGGPLNGRGGLRTTATDGHRAIYASVPLPDGAADLSRSIIPTKAVDVVLGLAADLGDQTEIHIDARENAWEFKAGDWIFSTKLIDSNFPDADRVCPTANPHTLLIDSAMMRDALRRVTLVSGDRERVVALNLECDCLTISTQSAEHGDASEDVACKWEGPAMRIGFKGGYLADLAAVIADKGVISLEMHEPGNPIVMRTEGECDWFAVLMPYRM